jgi:hypothetical protein
MFGHGFEQPTILRTGPDGLTRVITRRSWAERESVLVEPCRATQEVSHGTTIIHHAEAERPTT